MFLNFQDYQNQQYRDFRLHQIHLFLEYQLSINEQELPKFQEH
jgi:hypothetical protein